MASVWHTAHESAVTNKRKQNTSVTRHVPYYTTYLALKSGTGIQDNINKSDF